jgi:predicted RNase H-like nuclease (RuvC/YqgF family)
LTEAKKGGHNYGSGMEVVKEKKAPKEDKQKVEEMKDGKKNGHSLEELKAAHKKLSSKINEMEKGDHKIDEAVSPELAQAIDQVVNFFKDNAGYLAGVGGIVGLGKMIANKMNQDPELKKSLDKATGAGSTERGPF